MAAQLTTEEIDSHIAEFVLAEALARAGQDAAPADGAPAAPAEDDTEEPSNPLRDKLKERVKAMGKLGLNFLNGAVDVIQRKVSLPGLDAIIDKAQAAATKQAQNLLDRSVDHAAAKYIKAESSSVIRDRLGRYWAKLLPYFIY